MFTNMRKYLILLIIFLSCTDIQAQGLNDKTKHFGAGFIIGGVGGYTANKIFDENRYWTWAGAVGSSLAAGIVKEAWDEANGGFVETHDVVYTVLGGIITSGLLLELLLNKKRKSRGGRGRYRTGKSCGCLVVGVDIEEYKEVEVSTIYIENGSRDIVSAIQARNIYGAY